MKIKNDKNEWNTLQRYCKFPQQIDERHKPSIIINKN